MSRGFNALLPETHQLRSWSHCGALSRHLQAEPLTARQRNQFFRIPFPTAISLHAVRDNLERTIRQRSLQCLRCGPRTGFDLVPRSHLNSVQIPAKANSGRSSLSAGRTIEEFVRLFVIIVFIKHLSERSARPATLRLRGWPWSQRLCAFRRGSYSSTQELRASREPH
jgi:hypothetical protein